jgi:hypothetical protein
VFDGIESHMEIDRIVGKPQSGRASDDGMRTELTLQILRDLNVVRPEEPTGDCRTTSGVEDPNPTVGGSPERFDDLGSLPMALELVKWQIEHLVGLAATDDGCGRSPPATCHRFGRRDCARFTVRGTRWCAEILDQWVRRDRPSVLSRQRADA